MSPLSTIWLRVRSGDVQLLARAFAGAHAITARALHQLDGYAWPENVAELRSVIVCAAQLASDDPIDTVHLPMHLQYAPEYPDQAFATSLPIDGSPPNVEGLLFKEQEVGYLAGYLAGLAEKRAPGDDVISAVGGMKEPPVDRFIAGYQAGARKADPGITILNGYSQDWDDQAKCKELALDQIANGSHIVFQVAGKYLEPSAPLELWADVLASELPGARRLDGAAGAFLLTPPESGSYTAALR